MIERLQGEVIATGDRSLTLMVGGIGFGLLVADGTRFTLNATTILYTYVHWNSEKGQTLFGFADEMSRQLFLLLISCQKIGPAIALALLRQREPAALIQDIMSGNISGLSSCQGIGTKKAELIIYELKDKVSEIATLGVFTHAAVGQLKHVQDALLSLSYSKQETSDAVSYIAGLHGNGKFPELNVLLRQALAFLSNPR